MITNTGSGLLITMNGGAEMTETLHEIAVRMSDGRCGKHCDSSCPANAFHHGRPCLVCVIAQIDNADDQLEAMIAWGKEHHKRTWLDLFDAAFPNALRRGNKAPRACPDALYGSVAENRDCMDGCYDGNCFDCWNREVEGGDDQRGRI